MSSSKRGIMLISAQVLAPRYGAEIVLIVVDFVQALLDMQQCAEYESCSRNTGMLSGILVQSMFTQEAAHEYEHSVVPVALAQHNQ